MDTDARGQLGGMDSSEEVRKRLAASSKGWKCSTCGTTNEAIMKEQDELVKEKGGEGKVEEVPEELRLAYREDLSNANGDASKASQDPTAPSVKQSPESNVEAVPESATTTAVQDVQQQQPHATVDQPAQAQQAQRQRQDDGVPPWIDKAIYGIIAVLFYLLWKKIGA